MFTHSSGSSFFLVKRKLKDTNFGIRSDRIVTKKLRGFYARVVHFKCVIKADNVHTFFSVF